MLESALSKADGKTSRFSVERVAGAIFGTLETQAKKRRPSILKFVLSVADLVVVTDVYPAREQPIRGVTGKIVAKAARAAGARVEWVERLSDLPPVLCGLVQRGDVVLTLGAGDITQIGPALLNQLAGAAA